MNAIARLLLYEVLLAGRGLCDNELPAANLTRI
jgi:hypothetical protein